MGKSLMRPGFRFKPTDVELAMYYLKNKLIGIKLDPAVIADINIYDFSPSDLPAKSILSGDLEWYFFSPKPKRYSSGPRTKRATKTGYWKGTGNDKHIKYKGRTVAMRKTLIFHVGRLPKGTRTNWVMHEYRMEDVDLANQGVVQDAYVICKVFEKSGRGPKNGAQYGAPFEEEDTDDDDMSTVTSIMMVGVLVNPNNASCSSVIGLSGDATKMLDPNNASTSGPSTITYSENEGHIDVPVIDDVMLTHGDHPSMLCNKDTQEVDDRKGKKVMTDDGIDIFQELLAISNLDDLGQDAFDMFGVDDDCLGVDDDNLERDAFLPDDLLD